MTKTQNDAAIERERAHAEKQTTAHIQANGGGGVRCCALVGDTDKSRASDAESAGSGGAGGVKPCACGCGGMVKSPDKRGRERHWLKGHQRKVKNSMQNVLVAIGKPCRNCGGEIKARHKERNWALKMKDFCCNRCGILWNVKTRDNAQVTAAMRAASHTPEAQAKRTAGLRNSPKRMMATVAAHSEDAIKKANASRMVIPGFQSLPENFSAKWWRVRDDRGRIHEFKNLSWFIKVNPELFLAEDINWKDATRSRAYGGISSIRPSSTRRRVNGTWKGWTWYSQTERLKNEGHDLLDRDSVSLGGGGGVLVCDNDGETNARAQGYNGEHSNTPTQNP